MYTNKSTLNLPKISTISTQTFHQTLLKRKSIRDFSSTPISKEQLSYLLWASTGIQRKQNGFEFRTAPSAGALYPIETYLVIHNVTGIPPGVYHYNIQSHLLEEIEKGNYKTKITHAALHQLMCSTAAVVFIWTAIFNRSKCKYSQRAYRYIYLDAGHIAQNLALSASSMDLGSCQIAAFYDDEVNAIVDVDGVSESTIYLSVVGVPYKE